MSIVFRCNIVISSLTDDNKLIYFRYIWWGSQPEWSIPTSWPAIGRRSRQRKETCLLFQNYIFSINTYFLEKSIGMSWIRAIAPTRSPYIYLIICRPKFNLVFGKKIPATSKNIPPPPCFFPNIIFSTKDILNSYKWYL